MNLEKFFIIENKNGKKTQEIFLKKKYPDLYEKIINFCSKNLGDISFKEKVWHFIYNVDDKVLCKHCKKELKFKRSLSEGYGIYCSISCGNKCPEHIKKVKNTCIDKYGGVGTASKLLADKIEKTTNDKYGVDNIFKRKDIIKNGFLKKYGVENVWGVDGVREKTKETNLKRYGYETSFLNPVNRKKSIETKKKIFKEKYKDFNIISDDGDFIEINCDKCKQNYTINRSVLLHRFNLGVECCTNCNPININNSFAEREVIDFIKEILPNEDLVEKDRKILSPQEIDIIIPNKKIGIEYNGLFWHSSYSKDDKYHINKYKKCYEQGYKLIQIFEDEWLEKREIVKSIIKNSLNIFDKIIYGRKCIIKEIDNNMCKKFIDENHIQGHHNSKIKIGLFYENELVSVMTFGGLRKSLGMTHKDNHYEMIRFCNLKNTKIIGGASKLFNYFVKKYKPTQVISFSDNRYFTGDLYNKLGFNYSGETKPNYFYIKSRSRVNRFNFRKNVLVSMGYDKDKTEKEITEEMGLYRIYDCGNKKWVYNG
jgi:hypothetical protein